MRKCNLPKALLVIAILLFVSSGAQAVPTLGVATGGYLGDAACSAASNYQGCFGGPYISGTNEGFSIGSSPADLSIFTNITGADIWLVTTSDVQSANTPIVNGSYSLSLITPTAGNHWDGYAPIPYYGIDLGPVGGTTFGTWQTMDFSANGPFYYLDVTLSYSGTLLPSQYFFAVADDNGITGLQEQGLGSSNSDDFSPKTTSATGNVPEPSTFLLLGSGLLGLLFYRRKLNK